MARTLGSFKTRIRRYLREPTAALSFWGDPFVIQMFNACYRRRCSQLIMTHEGWFVNVAVRDIVDGQDRYAHPTGHQRTTKMELVRTGGSTSIIPKRERHAKGNPEGGGGGDTYCPNYRPLGNGFVLEPKPGATVTNALRLEYVGLPPELSADGDSTHVSFPDLFEELLVLDVVVMAYDAEGMQESGQLKSLLRLRQEWEFDWERFIENRTIGRQEIEPFMPHYEDA